MRAAIFIFTVCAVLLLVMFANGIYILSKSAGDWRTPAPVPISELSGYASMGSELSHPERNNSGVNPLNLLVLGLDGDETRCDVIMLFNFKPDLSRLNILSVARDTRIRGNGRHTKINTLYSKGGEKLVAEEVTKITGLPVHYYLIVDFKGFRKIIDTLGGVRFYVPFQMNYDDPTQNLHIHLAKGMQLLDGGKAEQLIRYRKDNAKGQGYIEGDIGRIKMQQDFLKELINQKANLKYVSRADDLFLILRDYVKTNVTLSDIAQNTGSISRIKSDEIRAFTLQGEGRMIGDVWYFIYNRSETADIIKSYFYR